MAHIPQRKPASENNRRREKGPRDANKGKDAVKVVRKPSDQAAAQPAGDSEERTKTKRQKRRRNRVNAKDKEGGESRETEAKSSAPSQAAPTLEAGQGTEKSSRRR